MKRIALVLFALALLLGASIVSFGLACFVAVVCVLVAIAAVMIRWCVMPWIDGSGWPA